MRLTQWQRWIAAGALHARSVQLCVLAAAGWCCQALVVVLLLLWGESVVVLMYRCSEMHTAFRDAL